MIVWPAVLLAASGALALQAPGAQLEGLIFVGRDAARLKPPAEAAVKSYANNGYRLSFDGEEAVVEVELTPIESTAVFSPPRGRGKHRGPVRHLALTLTRGSATQHEAVSRILSWVARSIRYDLDRSKDQSPIAVLERRAAYCTGIARLTVALLRSAEIVAREVPGLVVEPSPDLPSTPDYSYHRWIEVHYPDRGWVFSDPLVSHHFVPASYLRLAADLLRRPPREAPRLLRRHNEMRVADVYRHGPAQIVARPNRRQREAAVVRVRLGASGHGRAVLVGDGLRRQRDVLSGEAAFAGLEAGDYLLQIRLEGGETLQRSLRVADRSLLEVVAAPRASRASAATGGGRSPEPGSTRRRATPQP